MKIGGIEVVSPAELSSWTNIGVGGIAGAGKTHFLATVGKGRKVLILDLERGSSTYQSYAYYNDEHGTELENIHVLHFDDAKSSGDLADKIMAVLTHLVRTKNSENYILVAIDSITQFQEMFMSFHRSGDNRRSYLELKNTCYDIVQMARRVPCHTVFTARLRSFTDAKGTLEMLRYEVSPGSWSVISGLFDAIGYMDLEIRPDKTANRVLSFDHIPTRPGKDRYGFGTIENPSVRRLFGKLVANQEAMGKPVPVANPRAPEQENLDEAQQAHVGIKGDS